MVYTFDFVNKNILVLGASGLIARDLISELLRLKANVIGVDINPMKDPRFEHNEKYHHMNLDLTLEKSYIELSELLTSQFDSKINGLINAVQYKSVNFFNSISDFTLDEWNSIFYANVNPIFFVFKYFLDLMKNGKCNIVNFTSTYAIVSPNPELYEGLNFGSPAAYSASKGAVTALSRYLAIYYAKFGIRINTVSPHGVENNHDDKFIENFSKKSPMRRLSKVNEVTPIVLLLLSNLSSYVTASNYKIDGGWTAW